MARLRCALSIVALASLAACGEPQAPPSALGPRPSEALAAVHADATFVLHVDTAALRRSSFGPAASGALYAEIAKLAGLKYVPSCGETSTLDAFDDVVVSFRGANVHVGAHFAKGISESKESACAYALSASADRRGDLVVSPPGLELDPKAAAAQAELRLEGPQIARAKGQLPGAGATVDARLDSDTSSTTLSATLTAPTEVRARELALALDGLFGGEVAQARASGALEEAHVTKGTSIALSVRFVGAPGQQTATAAAVARGFSSKGVSELGKESLPEVRQKLTGMADALEKYAKENGKFPPSTRWTPGVTPRGAKVPVVSDSADDRSWQLVGVSWKNERTAFRYRFEISDDGAKATLEAHGDLDADEKESTFRIVLEKKPDGTIVRGKLEELDPLE